LKPELLNGGRIHIIGANGLPGEIESHGLTVFRLEDAPSQMTHKEVQYGNVSSLNNDLMLW
jgi:hypothetical protein